METIYKAFDGKEFENEGDCIVWELGADLRELKKQNKFDVFDWNKQSTDNYDEAKYFVVKTYTAAQALDDYFSNLRIEGYYNEYSNPFEDFEIAPGFYIWDNNIELWVNAFETIHAIMNTANSLKVFEADFEKEKE